MKFISNLKKYVALLMICMFIFSCSNTKGMEGQHILSFLEDDTFVLFDVDQKKVIEKIPGFQKKYGRPVVFLNDGRRMICETFAPYPSFNIEEVRLVDLEAKQVVRQFAIPDDVFASDRYFSPDGKHSFVLKRREPYIAMQKVGAPDVQVKRFKRKGVGGSLFFSPDGTVMILRTEGKDKDTIFLQIWDVETGVLLGEHTREGYEWCHISVSNRGEYIALNTKRNSSIEIITISGEKVTTIPLPGFAHEFALSFDGQYVGVCVKLPDIRIYSFDGTYVLDDMSDKATIFSVKTGQKVAEYPLEKREDVMSMQFKPPLKIKDPDEPKRVNYVQEKLLKEESDVILPKMKVKMRIHGKDDFYIPRLPL